MEKFLLEQSEVAKNIARLQQFIVEKQLDAFYISSFDIYLSEYVPREECHRYYYTGFTGSVAEVLVTKTHVHLFVDGRYHEQADKECKDARIVVQKCSMDQSIRAALLDVIKNESLQDIGIESDRTDLGFYEQLKNTAKVVCFHSNIFPYHIHQGGNEAWKVNDLDAGWSTQEKLEMLLDENEGLYMAGLDSVAWLTNMRGFQMPFQSMFKASLLATKKKIYLFTNSHLKSAPCEVEVVSGGLAAMKNKIKISKLFYNPDRVNVFDYELLQESWGQCLTVDRERVISLQSVKRPGELQAMERAFEKSSKAVARSLNWLAQNYQNGVSEWDFSQKVTAFYQEYGMLEHSFHNITGFGENSSIIHYGTPSKKRLAKEGDFALLDSGAYYEDGFATDKTRTILLGSSASAKQKEMYTRVLKGLLQVQNKVFPKTMTGLELDQLARQALKEKGLDYNHGTGHGVGINVHEGNYSISTKAKNPLVAGTVGSIEPGYYEASWGGIRLENVVVVEEKDDKHFCFRPLVFVGFDHKLIDETLLTDKERKWLAAYEAECTQRGTSYTG